jgi:hypothetical protein
MTSLEGFDYYPMGEEYEVVARAAEAEVVYRSGDPLSTLAGKGPAGDAGTAETRGDRP